MNKKRNIIEEWIPLNLDSVKFVLVSMYKASPFNPPNILGICTDAQSCKLKQIIISKILRLRGVLDDGIHSLF